jgi:hypothetical protein
MSHDDAYGERFSRERREQEALDAKIANLILWVTTQEQAVEWTPKELAGLRFARYLVEQGRLSEALGRGEEH